MKESLCVTGFKGLNYSGNDSKLFIMEFTGNEYMLEIWVNIFYTKRFEGTADSCSPHVLGFYS